MSFYEPIRSNVSGVLFLQSKNSFIYLDSPYYIIPAKQQSSLDEQEYQEDLHSFFEKWYNGKIRIVNYPH